MSARVALAVNPTSGKGRGGVVAGQAFAALTDAGVEVVRLVGRDAADLRAQVDAALADGVRGLVVAGGDGMVHLGVDAVAGRGVPLGIVPAGTGNDVARALGLPVGDGAAAARVVVDALRSGATRAVDAVRTTTPDGATRWFAGVLAAGFDAVVNERANRMRRPKGRRRYDLAVALELPRFHPRAYRLRVDGADHDTDAMLVAVANAPSYGGGMRVCPDAALDDGLLDVLVVGPIGRVELLRVFPKVFAGTHVTHPAVRVLRGRRVEVASAGIVGYADGERLAPLPLVCEAVAGAVGLLAVGGPV